MNDLDFSLIGHGSASFCCLFGMRGQGKSNFVADLLQRPEYRNHLVYDTVQEHEGTAEHRYLPTHRKGDEGKAEFGQVLERTVTEVRYERRPDLFVAEEFNRYAPNQGATPGAVVELVDFCRHMGVGFLGVARRPAQVDPDLVELSDLIVTFRLKGKNDRKRLNKEHDGLGDRAKNLDDHHFLVYDGRTVVECAPLPEHDTTGRI